MIDTQRRSTVVAQGMQAHKLPVSCLVQGVLAEELLSCRNRAIVVTFLFQEHDQAFCR